MQALRFDGRTLDLVRDFPRPAPAAGEVLVRVLMAGICETDLQIFRGYMGFQGIPGHEFVGIAESGRYAGRRVVGEINCSCNTCETCCSGRRSHCPNRTVLGILGRNGAFAEEIVLPEENLHLVPEGVSTSAAVFVEPLAAACRILEQVTVRRHDRVVVLGDGRLGLLCALVLMCASAEVTIVGKHPEKLARASRMGIPRVLTTSTRPEKIASLVVDCTGAPSGLEAALQWVAPLGTVVLKTTVAATHALSLAPVVIDEIRVVGSRCGPFAPALSLLEQNAIDVESLIDATYPLSEGVAACERAQVPGTFKVLIRMDF